MKKILSSVLFCTLCFAFGSNVSAASSSAITRTKTVQIELDSRNGQASQRIDVGSLQEELPDECKRADTACVQKSKVTVTVETTWTPVNVATLSNAALDSTTFANDYPQIETSAALSNGSDPLRVGMLQRVLYQEKLLADLPSGKYGYATERAVVLLQKKYGFSEIDRKKGMVVAGPLTIAVANALKAGLQPELPLQKAFDQKYLDNRAKALDSLIKKTPKPTTTVQQSSKNAQSLSPQKLNFSGEIVLKK